jgi:activator of HSP90 ATPase
MARRSIIRQSIVLPAAPAKLFAMYLDPKKHAAITGGAVTISAKPNSRFRAFNGSLSGRTLLAEKPHLIVQSWRSTNFRADDADSTLFLSFHAEGKSKGRIELVHLDVPKGDYKGVMEGWELYYWTPWRRLLQA